MVAPKEDNVMVDKEAQAGDIRSCGGIDRPERLKPPVRQHHVQTPQLVRQAVRQHLSN